MLTFDNQYREDKPDVPLAGVSADLIEIGENDAIWYRVSRSKRELYLVDKITGKTRKTAAMDDNFMVVARSYGLSMRQIGTALAALRLEK